MKRAPHTLSALVAEDRDEMRTIIRAILEGLHFHKVHVAEDGEEALSLIREHAGSSDPEKRIQLVVADWMMPKLDGLELLKSIRNDKSLEGIIFLMVTGEDAESSVVNAIAHGVSDYITKPFTRISLEKKILRLLGESTPITEEKLKSTRTS